MRHHEPVEVEQRSSRRRRLLAALLGAALVSGIAYGTTNWIAGLTGGVERRGAVGVRFEHLDRGGGESGREQPALPGCQR